MQRSHWNNLQPGWQSGAVLQIDKLISQSVGQSVSQSVGQSVSRSVSQSANRSINQ